MNLPNTNVVTFFDSKTRQNWPSFTDHRMSRAARHIYSVLGKETSVDGQFHTTSSPNKKNSNLSLYDFADKIMRYVNSRSVFVVNNYPVNFTDRTIKINPEKTKWVDLQTEELLISQEFDDDLDAMWTLLGEMTQDDRSVIYSNASRADKVEALRRLARTTEDLHIGTCLFLCAVGFIYSQQFGEDAPWVEMYKLADPADHVFLVMKPKRFQEKNDQDDQDVEGTQNITVSDACKNWPHNTLVVDLWTGKIFSKKEMCEKLESYVENYRYFPVVEKICAKTQKLLKII